MEFTSLGSNMLWYPPCFTGKKIKKQIYWVHCKWGVLLGISLLISKGLLYIIIMITTFSFSKANWMNKQINSFIFFCIFFKQVPAYIITLHDLLALTPHDHVERNTLQYAQSVLEDLSTVSHKSCNQTSAGMVNW